MREQGKESSQTHREVKDVSNKDVKQDALDNLADALTEDILNTPDDELLREVEEDYGDPHALANKFDQILERAEKQVRPSPQVRSSVLDLLYRLREWASTLFGAGPGGYSVVWASAAAVLIAVVLASAVLELEKRSEQLATLEKQLAVQESALLAWSEQLAARSKFGEVPPGVFIPKRPRSGEATAAAAPVTGPIPEPNQATPEPIPEPNILCKNLTTEQFEHLICFDTDLEFWQHLMMEIYRHRELQLDTNGQEILRQGQLDWLGKLRNDCNAAFQVPVSGTEIARAKSCVLQSTKERVAVLSNN